MAGMLFSNQTALFGERPGLQNLSHHVGCITNVSGTLLYTLWFCLVGGSVCLLLFGILRGLLKSTYHKRLDIPDLEADPPPPRLGGLQQLWSWLYPVLMLSDVDLLRTAGLDALMLNRCLTLGVQLFVPMAVVGCAILLPVNLHGRALVSTQPGAPPPSELMLQTLSNLKDASHLLWVPFGVAYVFCAYTCWLLRLHFRSYVILRHAYLENREFEPCPVELPSGSPALRNLTTVLYNLFSLFNPLQARLSSLRRVTLGKLPSEVALQTLKVVCTGGHAIEMLRNDAEAVPSAVTVKPIRLLGEAASEGMVLRSAPPSAHFDDATLGLTAAPNSRSGIRNTLSTGGNSDGADKQPLGLHAPGAPVPQPAPSEAPRQEGEAGTQQGSNPFGVTAPAPAGLRPTASEFQRRQGEAGSLAGSGSDHVGFSGRDAGLHRDNSASGMLAGCAAGSSAEWAEGVAVYPWWVQRPPGGPIPPALGQIADHVLPGRATVRLQQLVRAGDGSLRNRGNWVNAAQYAVLVTDLTETEEERVDSALTLNSPTGSRRRDDTRDIEMATVDLDASLEGPEDEKAWAAGRGADHHGAGVPNPKPDQRPSLFARPWQRGLGRGSDGGGFETPQGKSKGLDGRPSLARSVMASARPRRDRADLLAESFRWMFPRSFDRLVPVSNCRKLEVLLLRWDRAQDDLAAARAAQACCEAAGRAVGAKKAPTVAAGCCGCLRPRVDAVVHYSTQVDRAAKAVVRLESEILAERARVLADPRPASYFALFNSQKDALVAAQVNLIADGGLSFAVHPAPAPDDVNWPALWLGWRPRVLRTVAVVLPVAAIMVFPIGIFTGELYYHELGCAGALTNLHIAVCGGNPATNKIYWKWFCNATGGNARVARELLTGVVPVIISSAWDTFVLPLLFYMLAQSERRCMSLHALDKRVSSFFFYFATFNTFFGAALGGSIFSQLGAAIQNPGQIFRLLGTAVPSSSNFFLNYVLTKALFYNLLRLLWPHNGVLLAAITRSLGLSRPKTPQQREVVRLAPSYRSGRHYGAFMTIFVIALAFAVTAPLILPIAGAYFLTGWLVWRYCQLYFYERTYESGGLMFEFVFNRVMICQLIFVFFTGCVFIVKRGYWQAGLLWFTLTPLLSLFWKYCNVYFVVRGRSMPLNAAMAAPRVLLDPAVYTQPALRPGAYGWSPEAGVVWFKYGVPKYTL